MSGNRTLRTPLSRVRHLGSARSGTQHFWRQCLTSVALIPLTIGFVLIVVGLLGRNQAAVAQILGSPFIAIVMLLFIVTTGYHMWLGMQTIIEDYVHHELLKMATLMANIFFSFAATLTSVYAICQLSFGL
jgi:succinate dehydrogenase / fumarate reductase membrane anchor subunit